MSRPVNTCNGNRYGIFFVTRFLGMCQILKHIPIPILFRNWREIIYTK